MATATKDTIPAHGVDFRAVTQSAPHFSVDRDALVRELSLAIGAVERRTTIPILGNVKLEASDFGHLSITATDLEICLYCRCDAEVKKPGAATLPAKRLLDYVRLLPAGSLDIKFGDTQWASITAGRSKMRIAGMSVESYPYVPTSGNAICSVPLKALARLIGRVSYAISMQESRFTLNGALLETGDTGLKMVATDGHRLTLAEMGGSGIPAKNLIPRKALVELNRLAGAVPLDAVVEIATDDNHLFFTVGDRILAARRLIGNFPEYERVIPKGFTGCAIFNRLALRDGLQRVRGFADERSRAIKVAIGNGQVSASAQALETGEAEDVVSAETSGEVTIGFNAEYLIDFLGSTEAEKVALSFADEKSAMQLSPVGDGDSRYVCVVMPLRI